MNERTLLVLAIVCAAATGAGFLWMLGLHNDADFMWAVQFAARELP